MTMITSEETKAKRVPNPFRKMDADRGYEYLMKQFILRKSVDERVYPLVTGRGNSGGGGFVSQSYEGRRMEVKLNDEGIQCLYSYRMILATWIGNRLVLNGDGVQSRQTRARQEQFRNLVRKLNGVEYVHEPEPDFKLWTDELSARWETMEGAAQAEWRQAALDAHESGCENEHCKCKHIHGLSVCRCTYIKTDYSKPAGDDGYEHKVVEVGNHEYKPLTTRDHNWASSEEHAKAWATWEKDPEWAAHSARWHAEKARLAIGHKTYQHVSAYCPECGEKMDRVDPDHYDWSCKTHNSQQPFKMEYSIIPFATLGYDTISGMYRSDAWWGRGRTAQVRLSDIEIVHCTSDFTVTKKTMKVFPKPRVGQWYNGKSIKSLTRDEPCKHCKVVFGGDASHMHEVEVEHHFLGETLFRTLVQFHDETTPLREDSYRYYVCGLDRNDPPSLRKFFLARLPSNVQWSMGPRKAEPTSVDEALDTLRPVGLGRDTPRQGEWFFLRIPPDSAVGKRLDHKRLKLDKGDGSFTALFELKQEPVVSDNPDEQAQRGRGEREGRHVAFRMKGYDGAVYVKGKIKDEEHQTLDLGMDSWFKVVRNTADGAWSVDPDGPQVD